MKRALLKDSKKLVIEDVPEPTIDDNEVLIKIKYCGICGSDLHIYLEGLPLGLGHEFSGDIVKTGPDVERWEIGDRVTVKLQNPCGECYWCRREETGLCDTMYQRSTGSRVTGFATFTKANHHNLYRLDDMSYEEGAMVEPTTIALHAVNLSGMKSGDSIAVLGLGPIGQLVARLSRAVGVKTIIATELSPSRRELAKNVVDEVIDPTMVDPVDRVFELTNRLGADIVFECAGVIETTQDSIAVAKKGGTIVIPGMCFESVETSIIDIVLKGLTIKGSMTYNEGEFSAAYELIKKKKIDVESVITSIMPLDDINEAFTKAFRGEGGKILIAP